MSKIPPELETEMSATVKAFVVALLQRLDEAEAKIEKLTPRNSSLPPSTELTVTTFGSFGREFPRDGQNWASVSRVYVPEAGSCSVELAVFLHLAQQ